MFILNSIGYIIIINIIKAFKIDICHVQCVFVLHLKWKIVEGRQYLLIFHYFVVPKTGVGVISIGLEKRLEYVLDEHKYYKIGVEYW